MHNTEGIFFLSVHFAHYLYMWTLCRIRSVKAQSKALAKAKYWFPIPQLDLQGHSLFLKNLGDKFQSFSENIRKEVLPVSLSGPKHVYYSTYGLGISHDKGKPPEKTFKQVCFFPFFPWIKAATASGLVSLGKAPATSSARKAGPYEGMIPNFTWLVWVAPKTPVKPEKKLRNWRSSGFGRG